MNEKTEREGPYFNGSAQWNKKWDMSQISISKGSEKLLKSVLDLLKNHTDENGKVTKPGPMYGLTIPDRKIRFVQLHIPPYDKEAEEKLAQLYEELYEDYALYEQTLEDEEIFLDTPIEDTKNYDTFEIELAIGLSRYNNYTQAFIKEFGNDRVCQSASKRAPGVVHKQLRSNIGGLQSDKSILGSSFYLNYEGKIDAANRSGQNEDLIAVNKLARLSAICSDDRPLRDQLPIRIANELFKPEHDLKTLNGEGVLIQKIRSRYFLYYKEPNKQGLTSIRINDLQVINSLRIIRFPEKDPEYLTKAFAELKSQNPESDFDTIKDYVDSTTNMVTDKIPYYDSYVFLYGGRNMPTELFKILNKNSINFINKKLNGAYKLKDVTDYSSLGSSRLEDFWGGIVNMKDKNSRNRLQELLLVKSLLMISTIDMHTRKYEHEKHYTEAFNTGCDYLVNLFGVNIFKKNYPQQITQEIGTYYHTVGLGQDQLSINLNEFPIWLSLYITALRNENTIILDNLENLLFIKNPPFYGEHTKLDITQMFIKGFRFAHENQHQNLYNRLKKAFQRLGWNTHLNLEKEVGKEKTQTSKLSRLGFLGKDTQSPKDKIKNKLNELIHTHSSVYKLAIDSVNNGASTIFHLKACDSNSPPELRLTFQENNVFPSLTIQIEDETIGPLRCDLSRITSTLEKIEEVFRLNLSGGFTPLL